MTSLHFLYLHASLNRFAGVFYFINKSIYCEEPLETQRSQALFGCTYVFMQCLHCMKGGLLVYKYNSINLIYHLADIMHVRFHATILKNCTNYKMNVYSQGMKFKIILAVLP